MQKRKLGNSGLEVAPLALGGNVFGWTADEPTSLKLLDAFIDKGFNLIDTADVYSHWVPGHKGGESETIMGNWLKKIGKRIQPILSTKVGLKMPNVCKVISEADLSKSQRGQMVKKYLTPRGFRILDALDQVAKRHNATPTQAALAWLIARPSITAPIASATNLKQLDELTGATSLELDESSIELLDKASAPDSENESRTSAAAD